ncbi:branched-chain amino acid ABC transporter permease [Streptomyces chrestomyceticus JCM 4735]|uniref:Branched-chain amino acid ABC transporter permease n=1 Tax=Streptomyces chrestomyceticus JCM 4735 TaxID=1306181 RepID=A0A7U9PZL2_9ACTN|nr:branched-chain amino acid ABC transporter permease [Streptomyces chrestomyceticus JCM 4735]
MAQETQRERDQQSQLPREIRTSEEFRGTRKIREAQELHEPQAPQSRQTKPSSAVVRDALGVGVAVGLSGFAFGVTAVGSGLSVLQTCALSLLVFTGASQFALVGALAAGGNPFTAAAGAFFLGTRNAFYGLRLSGLLGLRAAAKPFAAHWVIDETSAVALTQPDRRSARLGFAVTGVTLYLLWNLTTFAGARGAGALGDQAAWGLDAAGPAVFVALLAPLLTSTVERFAAGLAVVLLLVTLPLLPAGVPVLVAALAAPAVLYVEGRRARIRTSDEPETGVDVHVRGNGAGEADAR